MRMKKVLTTLLSLLIILFTTNATEARRNPRSCSSSCGDITNISYPFRLSNDPSDCGDPDFQLSCHNNTTILNFHGGLYRVKRISYQEHVIHVADVNLANGSCGLPYRSLSTDEILMDARYPGLPNYNYSYTLNYVRCSSNVSNLAKAKVPCLSTNTSNVYVNVTDYTLYSSDVPKSCKVISTLPTYYEFDSMHEAAYETVVKMQESGFDMIWSVECRDCRAKGRGCAYKDRDTTTMFECQKEFDYDAWVRLIYTAISLSFLAAFIGFVRFILLPMVIFGFLLHKYLSTRKEKKKKNGSENKKSSLQCYTYPDILAMSNNFKEKIGEGCFGSVYKGKLPGDCVVAVKMLGTSKLREEKFVSEISTMSMIQHPNLVPILGFCCEGSKYALVYQYMPNGSLDNSHSFSWEKLHDIALGTAQGIEYLHGKSNACIAHLDIKPQNILLDENFIPKIADFCLASLYPKKHDFLSMCATSEETTGYMAPELVSSDIGALSCKSDVYSFGMLLLELASGRRHVDVEAICSSKVHFPCWVYEVNERGDLEVEDMTETDATIARKLCIIGLWCTQTKASDRPSMSRVVEMLQGSINDLEMPPKPVFFLPKHKGVLELESDSPKQMLIPETMERSS